MAEYLGLARLAGPARSGAIRSLTKRQGSGVGFAEFQARVQDSPYGVFEPLEACHAMLRDIGAAIAHEIGASG